MSETSAADSRPVETYRFEISGYDPMLFTSDERAVTAEGDLYEALDGLSRSRLVIAPFGEDSSDLTITVPATSDLALRCGLIKTPQTVRLIWRRYQRSDLSTAVMRREATMESAVTRGLSTALLFPSPFDAGLAPRIPKNRIQPTCNWTLGDSNCRINLDLFKANVTRIAEPIQFTKVVSGRYIIQTEWADDVEPYDTKFWVGGVMTGVYDDFVEHRTIYEVKENRSRTGIEVRIALSRSFDMPLSGATFTITPGCDNSFARCAGLSNTPNFGGFPYVKTERENLFQIRLDKTRVKAD